MSWDEASADDMVRAKREREPAKPRPKGKIPYRPARSEPLPVWKDWLSNALGLPPEVRVEAVLRHGQDDADPLIVVLSNGMKMRCPHQKRLQVPASLQAFVASASNGVAQMDRLNQAEAGDVFVAMCVLGTSPAQADPAADLQEHLAAFVVLGSHFEGSLDLEHRYDTIDRLKSRPMFDRKAADDVRAGKPNGGTPVVLLDKILARRYVRAMEWITYLRHYVGQTVDPSALVARMAEISSERVHPQAWNSDRSRKVNVVLYTLPEDL